MTNGAFDAEMRRAILHMAETLKEMNQKLDYIIKKQTEDFFGQPKVTDKERWRQ